MFGKGTGVAPPLRPPGKKRRIFQERALSHCGNGDDQASRLISTGKLGQASPKGGPAGDVAVFTLPAYYLVVFKVPLGQLSCRDILS